MVSWLSTTYLALSILLYVCLSVITAILLFRAYRRFTTALNFILLSTTFIATLVYMMASIA